MERWRGGKKRWKYQKSRRKPRPEEMVSGGDGEELKGMNLIRMISVIKTKFTREQSDVVSHRERMRGVLSRLALFISFHYPSLNSTFEVFPLHSFILYFQPIVTFNTSPSPCLPFYALTNVIHFTPYVIIIWVYSFYNSTDEYLGESS